MTRPVEERLRAAMRARAGEVTARRPQAAWSPLPAPAPATREKRPVRLARWIPPLAIAAVAAMALAVPGIFAARHLAPDRLAAGPGFSGARLPPPPPAPDPSSDTHTPARAAAGTEATAMTVPLPAAPGPAVAPLDPAPRRGPAIIAFSGMTLDVPAGWTFQEYVADPGWACVWLRSPDRCELAFTPPGGSGYHLVHPDDPRPVAAQLDCLDISAPVEKLAATVVEVGGRSADYRLWRMNCMGVASDFEQWTISRYPAVKFHREHPDPETEDEVKTMLGGVRFAAAPTSDLVTDFGFILDYQRTPDGVQLTVDRATPVWRGVGRWDFENTNPATYRYLLDPGTAGFHDRAPGLCRTADFNAHVCEVDTFLLRLDEGGNRSDGGQPISTIPVWLNLDGGRLVSITPAGS